MAVILRWDTVKTRRPHQCFGCTKTYPVGATMARSTYTDGGFAYWCLTCQEYMRHCFDTGECIDRDMIITGSDAVNFVENAVHPSAESIARRDAFFEELDTDVSIECVGSEMFIDI